MQSQFNEGDVVLENHRLVDNGSENHDFSRRKSGVRVPSAPPLDLAIEELSVRELLEALLDDKAKRLLYFLKCNIPIMITPMPMNQFIR